LNKNTNPNKVEHVSNNPIKKVKTIVSKVKDKYNPKQQACHFAVALRDKGDVDFYCNFVYQDTWNPEKASLEKDKRARYAPVDDIDIDFCRIFFTTHLKEDPKQRIMCTNELSWQRNIGSDTLKFIKYDSEKQRVFETASHRRIAGHFKLYTSILSFKTFFLVAHRNFVTSFDMSKGNNEGSTKFKPKHFKFKDTVTAMSCLTPNDNNKVILPNNLNPGPLYKAPTSPGSP
jgi:hypothetical protein